MFCFQFYFEFYSVLPLCHLMTSELSSYFGLSASNVHMSEGTVPYKHKHRNPSTWQKGYTPETDKIDKTQQENKMQLKTVMEAQCASCAFWVLISTILSSLCDKLNLHFFSLPSQQDNICQIFSHTHKHFN